MVGSKNLARLISRDAHTMTVDVMGETEQYDVLKVIEFSSDRKMMTVVVRNCQSKEVLVFSKGASDSMVKKLRETDNENLNV